MLIAQVSAVAIFLTMFFLIVTEKVERHIATLGCGFLTLTVVFGLCMRSGRAVLEALNLYSIFQPNFWYQMGAATTSTGISMVRPISSPSFHVRFNTA